MGVLAKKKQFYISRHLIERLKSQNTWYAALSLTVSVLRVEYDPVLMRSKKLVSGTEYDLHNYANTSTKNLREFEFSFENSQKFSAVVMWRTCLRGTHFSPSIELDGCTASKTWLLKFKGVVWPGAFKIWQCQIGLIPHPYYLESVQMACKLSR